MTQLRHDGWGGQFKEGGPEGFYSTLADSEREFSLK